jgi:hypothetical protein
VRFYTQSECEEWLIGKNRQKPDAIPGVGGARILFPSETHRFFHFAKRIAESISFQMPVLLWTTEWGNWDSTENEHLYYRLRQSYGDQRLLWEAPGHFFLGYETADLASFLQLSMMNGWGGYLLAQANYVNVFFSHDEYFDFFAERVDLDDFLKELKTGRSNDNSGSR